MRIVASVCFCAFFIGLSPSAVQAQSQRSADVHMEIFGGLSITKVADMDFGNIAGPLAGTVVMTATASPTCTASAGIVHSGACRPARFGGAGESGRIVRIKKPPSNQITLTGPGTAMTITNLVLDGSPGLTLVQATSGYSRFRIDDVNGIFDFRLGGTLNVGANQAPGVYTGTFDITIQYN